MRVICGESTSSECCWRGVWGIKRLKVLRGRWLYNKVVGGDEEGEGEGGAGAGSSRQLAMSCASAPGDTFE